MRFFGLLGMPVISEPRPEGSVQARGGPPKRMKTLRKVYAASASALPPSFRSARSVTSVPVAPAISSLVFLRTASSTERLFEYVNKLLNWST